MPFGTILVSASSATALCASGLTAVTNAIRTGIAEEEAFVSAGLEATGTLAEASREVAQEGVKASDVSRKAAEVAVSNRQTIEQAIGRLVDLHSFVSESATQVNELGTVTRQITGFIGSIQEIADLTNLIALNAACLRRSSKSRRASGSHALMIASSAPRSPTC